MAISPVLAHFESTLGKSLRSQDLPRAQSFDPRVRVHECETAFGLRVFATDGFSQNRIPGVDATERFEFVVTAKQLSFETAMRILLAVTTTPLEDRLPPHSGETIGMPRPITESRGMQRLLLTDRWGEDTWRTILLPGMMVHVRMVVPIFECEFGLLRATDERHFWSAVEAERLDITDLGRAPLRRAETFVVQRDTVRGH